MPNYMTEFSPDNDTTVLQIKDIEALPRAEQRVLGAKNLLVYPYYDGTKTANVITITPQEDGTLALSNTATADTDYAFSNRSHPQYLPNGKYILRVESNSAINCNAYIDTTYNGNWKVLYNYISLNTDYEFVIDDNIQCSLVDAQNRKGVGFHLSIKNGVAGNGVILKPMLRLASDPDDTYVPYAMTNRELTENVEPILSSATWESGVASNVSEEVLAKQGHIVFWSFTLSGISVVAWDKIAKIPQGYRPYMPTHQHCAKPNNTALQIISSQGGSTAGDVKVVDAVSGSNIRFSATWYTNE